MKRRWVRGIVGMALLGGLAGLIAFFRLREPMLLERAAFTANTGPWHQGERFRSDVGVHWLSDDTLLFSRFEGPGGTDRFVYRYSVKTGREEKLTGLTEARNDFPAEVVDSQNVSPDGRWFVCSSRWDDCLLAEVNGRRHYTYPSADSANYRSLLWLPDAHHWLENYVNGGSSSRLILHDTDHPQTSVSIPVRSEREQKLFGALDAVVSPQEGISIVEPDHDGDGIDAVPIDDDTPIVLTVSRVSLDAQATVRAEYKVMVPGRTGRYRLHVSPHGDRIAWQVTTQRATPGEQWLHRFLPFFHLNVHPRAEVWACHLDGSRMHLIGTLNLTPDDSSDALSLLQWLPDGKRLSFEYKSVLYTISADEGGR